MSLEKARDVFAGTAPKYRDVPGLIRKYYLLSEDGGTAGGVYLWETREAAEAMYNREWYAFIEEKYGRSNITSLFQRFAAGDDLDMALEATFGLNYRDFRLLILRNFPQ